MRFFKTADQSQFKRRWYQYSLRTLLIFVTLFAVACSFTVNWLRAKQQQQAIHVIHELFGTVEYDDEFNAHSNPDKAHHLPAWLVNFLGDDFLRTVVAVYFDRFGPNPNICDITDDDLKIVRELPHIEMLSLCRTQITDKGLENLDGLSQLRWLLLENIQITDAGLEHLKGLTRLSQLDLKGTQVTDDGVAKLQRSLPICYIQH